MALASYDFTSLFRVVRIGLAILAHLADSNALAGILITTTIRAVLLLARAASSCASTLGHRRLAVKCERHSVIFSIKQWPPCKIGRCRMGPRKRMLKNRAPYSSSRSRACWCNLVPKTGRADLRYMDRQAPLPRASRSTSLVGAYPPFPTKGTRRPLRENKFENKSYLLRTLIRRIVIVVLIGG
jgi:hypothetical protein